MTNNEANATIARFKDMLKAQNGYQIRDTARPLYGAMLEADVPQDSARWVFDNLLAAIEAGNDDLAMHHFRYAVLMAQN